MSAIYKTVGAYEAKTKLAELLDRAASGEVITITKHNEPVAKIISAKTPNRANLESLFSEMDEIRARSPLNPPGKPLLSITSLIEEGRK